MSKYHPECYSCSKRDDECKESEWNEKEEPCQDYNPIVPPGFPEDMVNAIPDLLG